MMRGRFQELACVGLCMAIAIGTALMSYDVGKRKMQVERLNAQISQDSERIEKLRLTLQARTSLQTLEGINARYFQMSAPDRQQFFPSLAAADHRLHNADEGGLPSTAGMVPTAADPAIAAIDMVRAAAVDPLSASAQTAPQQVRVPLVHAPRPSTDVPLQIPQRQSAPDARLIPVADGGVVR